MPIFEYKCEQCAHEFEELVSGSSPSIQCPNCGSTGVKKLLSVFGFKSSGQFRSSAAPAECSSCTAKTCSSCGISGK